jgi:nitroimidazol reductase NimA-like FMN-containing flavoprotein (pyridoxamine 5'-phosphate oxidase superfamily)
MASIPDNYLDLLQEKKAFANLATVRADGSPQVTPVWVDYSGGLIRFNTAKGRVKARILKPGSPVPRDHGSRQSLPLYPDPRPGAPRP